MNNSVIAVTIFNVDDEILIQSVCLGDITTDFKWKSGKKTLLFEISWSFLVWLLENREIFEFALTLT